MCGIAGWWSTRAWPEAAATAAAMGAALAHRGPDSDGVLTIGADGPCLVHRRLAIQDLSSAGHQPMSSDDGRFHIVYNGEIYNHFALRDELAKAALAPRWRGHSDTETLLAAIAAWGLEAALSRCNGMFAFALYDAERRELAFARDRLGEKPLYVGRFGDTVVFGSELAALRAHPAFRASIDAEALAAYVARACVPAPRCIYEDVVKLAPGHCLTLARADAPLPEQRPYWSIARVAAAGAAEPLAGSDEELEERLADALERAVALRLISDVPLGAFLSGGFDSSLVVALMRASGARPVRTFTIGFREAGFDEAPHARAVAEHLGTEHTELYVEPREALGVIPRLPRIYDEPFADSSQIPTSLVAAMTRESVTVSLSGDGGDELFGGYTRYVDAPRIWEALARYPLALRAPLAAGVAPLGRPLRRLLEGSGLALGARASRLLLKGERLAPLVGRRDGEEVFHALLTHWGGQRLLRGRAPVAPERPPAPALGSSLQRMMYDDMTRYLPDTIMTKVDRASMAVSLEARAPLLDHELVELAWRLPDRTRVRDGQGKWLMRRVLERYLPRALVDRPKMGFAVPLAEWLRGPLREWAEALLEPRRLREEGWFDVALLRRVWDEHRSGAWDHYHDLWVVLMFQAWLDEHHRGYRR